jgi:ADP-heptose:LPS heptosyltransferase
VAKKYRLLHGRSPGDIVVMTGFVRDLKRAFPDLQVDVKTSCKDIWRHNPHITKIPETEEVRQIKLCYQSGIKRQNRETVHFLGEFHYNFERQTRIHVPVTEPKPDLHLSPDEQAAPLIAGRYWVVVAGGKSDATVKIWDYRYWQTTVDLLARYGIQVVQLGARDHGHDHAPLTGTLDLVGKTNLRDMIRIIANAEGVVCGVTAAMHMAAALERPCVVVAGGREAPWWEGYYLENKGLGCPEKLKVPHRFLHTIGLLSCCKSFGCWKNKTIPLHGDKLLCHMPVIKPGQAVPRCMDIITPEMVINGVLSYYFDGTLPPYPGLSL